MRINPLSLFVIFVNSPTVIGMFKPMRCTSVLTVSFKSCMLSLNYHRVTEWFGLEGTSEDHLFQTLCHG